MPLLGQMFDPTIPPPAQALFLKFSYQTAKNDSPLRIETYSLRNYICPSIDQNGEEGLYQEGGSSNPQPFNTLLWI